ncbi:putative N-acetyltransferase [Vibrio crassostreae]|uniref:hypothetical protein n=1 Tax=Vibrio crassostreae TaxID=246167 RepID=UPI00070FD900|nr:hypothetical protein [Vibrio crassostreae]TCT62598.1 hypothetical protein EDB44_10822 [Vibrio crassostreae]TCT83357.1 hypothetical protein EDB43_10822 [Vibrio crassostreae]TCU03768.1 hypothetical protein EDB47_10922 [Vibrio crassostreae]TDW09508.1 hypothetical protein EDB45_10722 [Vibrio crassostreae]CAK2048522.1 putative N-acetyltransferase [Vibrio crassostreae]
MFNLFKKKQKNNRAGANIDTGADMAKEMFDNFAYATENGLIEWEQTQLFTNVFVHFDQPEGKNRFTYFIPSATEESLPIAVAQFIMNGVDNDGYMVFAASWFVADYERNLGQGTQVVYRAIKEMVHRFSGAYKGRGIAFEAIINVNNTASNKLVKKIMNGNDIVTSENEHGETVSNYLWKVEF